MSNLLSSLPAKVLTAIMLAGGLVAVGYFFGGEEEGGSKKKKKQKGRMMPPGAFNDDHESEGAPPSLEEIQEQLAGMSEAEQQEYIQRLLAEHPPEDQLEEDDDEMAALAAPPPRRPKKPGHKASVGSAQPKGAQKLPAMVQKAEQLKQQGKMKDAAQIYTSILQIIREERGEENLDAAMVLYALALCQKDMGDKDDEALVNLNRAIALMEKFAMMLPIDQFADALATASDHLLKMKRYDEADKHLERAIGLIDRKRQQVQQLPLKTTKDATQKEELQKQVGLQMAVLIDNKARLRWKQDKLEEALQLNKLSSNMLLTAGGAAFTATIQSYLRLGELLIQAGRLDEGDSVYEGFLDEHRKLLGEKGYLQEAVLRYFFASANFQMKHYPLAEKHYRAAAELLKTMIKTEDHPSGIKQSMLETIPQLNEALNSLQLSQFAEGKDAEAKETIEELRKYLKQSLNASVPLSSSNYFATLTSNVLFETDEETKSKHPYFNVTLKPEDDGKNKLPATYHLVCSFQNPEEGSEDVVVEQGVVAADIKDFITLRSPRLSTIREGYFLVVMRIYTDANKTEQLGVHTQLVGSATDPRKIDETNEMFKRLLDASLSSSAAPAQTNGFESNGKDRVHIEEAVDSLDDVDDNGKPDISLDEAD